MCAQHHRNYLRLPRWRLDPCVGWCVREDRLKRECYHDRHSILYRICLDVRLTAGCAVPKGVPLCCAPGAGESLVGRHRALCHEAEAAVSQELLLCSAVALLFSRLPGICWRAIDH